MSLKKERVESIILRQVAKTITTEINDPSLKYANVTDVEVTNDLSFATVYVSFLDEKDKVKGMEALIKAKPAAAKGQYIKSCVVATTMGPGIKINSNKIS